MTRLPAWAEALDTFLTDMRHRRFAWCTNDCCTFAANAVLAMTGADPMSTLRTRYATQQGAARLVARAGGLHPLVCQYLGAPMQHTLTARRGDVVQIALDDADGPAALGICTGTHIAAPGPAGMVWLPITAATAAWRV
jgi:hypothetical protein